MQLRAETTARRLKTRDLRQNFQTFKSILNSGALFFSLDKDKKVIRISQVSDHDRSGVANWEIRAEKKTIEDPWHAAKISNLQKQSMFRGQIRDSQLSIQHSSITCTLLLHTRKKLISTRCLLATFHAHRVRYLYEFHLLVFLGIKCSREEILYPIRL